MISRENMTFGGKWQLVEKKGEIRKKGGWESLLELWEENWFCGSGRGGGLWLTCIMFIYIPFGSNYQFLNQDTKVLNGLGSSHWSCSSVSGDKIYWTYSIITTWASVCWIALKWNGQDFMDIQYNHYLIVSLLDSSRVKWTRFLGHTV